MVTNIDAEHLHHYGTHDAVKHAFADFINRVPFYGLAVLCLEHPHVQAISATRSRCSRACSAA